MNETVNINMSKNKSIHCFTHADLDGAVTFLATKWAHPGYRVSVNAIKSVDAARQDVTTWLLNNKFSDFERVFFLDLDVSELKDLIDFENVVIIDHHKSHVDNMDYKKAVPIIKEYPSACLLAYKIFKKLYNTEFNDKQKRLIVYGNDYDSYTLDLPESKMLNVIFWNTQRSFDSFIKTYNSGYVPFTKQQLAIYKIYENELTKIINNLEVYQGVYNDENDEPRIFVSTFANKHINDVSDYILDNYETDVVAIVNLKTNHISFRRPKDGDMKLNILAETIAEGGGHEYASGGLITTAFLEFTKSLNPV